MEETIIRKYAKLMGELGLTGMEVTEEGTVLRLERSAAPTAPAKEAVLLPESPVSEHHDARDIASPMVGVFYAAPAENAAPYVAVGDRVRKGDTLCIIEAMKLMNEVTAEFDGVVKEICAGNAQVVDYGTVLFRIAEEPS